MRCDWMLEREEGHSHSSCDNMYVGDETAETSVLCHSQTMVRGAK